MSTPLFPHFRDHSLSHRSEERSTQFQLNREDDRVYQDGIREFYSPTHVIFGWGASARDGNSGSDQWVPGAGLNRGPIESLREAGIEVVLFADEVDPALPTVERALRLDVVVEGGLRRWRCMRPRIG
jgi:hypothetical protein